MLCFTVFIEGREASLHPRPPFPGVSGMHSMDSFVLGCFYWFPIISSATVIGGVIVDDSTIRSRSPSPPISNVIPFLITCIVLSKSAPMSVL